VTRYRYAIIACAVVVMWEYNNVQPYATYEQKAFSFVTQSTIFSSSLI
jgi:hypothetical protein